jgi:hypothetical protein
VPLPATPQQLQQRQRLTLTQRPSAVGGGDKDGRGQRRQRQLEDTLFSLETRAQQLAREVCVYVCVWMDVCVLLGLGVGMMGCCMSTC